MFYGIKIVRIVEIANFLEIIRDYKPEQIICTDHTFFRLSESQRKIFKCETLRELIIHDEPLSVGLQQNGNYAVFYKHEKKVIRVIIDLQNEKINIVTFYFVNQVPRIK